jgi:putative hydrolase of the HAD superfamily
MSSIKAVVFDYGKVISYPPRREEREAIAAMAGITLADLDDLDRKRRREYDLGHFDGKGYYKSILADKGIFHDDQSLEKMAQADTSSWLRINADTEKLMEDIKGAGCKVGILSNMPYDFLAWARENIPLFTRYDAALFSCEEGIVKPEKAIYERIVSRLGCEYSEVVFFDDIEANVKGAALLGIHAFVFTDCASARKILCSLGVPNIGDDTVAR